MPKLGPCDVNPQKQPLVDMSIKLSNNKPAVVCVRAIARPFVRLAVFRENGSRLRFTMRPLGALRAAAVVIVLVWGKLAGFSVCAAKIPAAITALLASNEY
jgi:hypothetical protein